MRPPAVAAPCARAGEVREARKSGQVGPNGLRPVKAESPGRYRPGLSFGGGTGTRTPNPLLAKQVRYQLRHAPEMELLQYIPPGRVFKPSCSGWSYSTLSVEAFQTDFSAAVSCHFLKAKTPAAVAAAIAISFFTVSPCRCGQPFSWSSVGVPGLEPGTSSLSAKRSNRLSYTPRYLTGPR